MKAFYFAEKSRKLRYGDGRDIVVGESHTVEVEPKVCQRGLHASTSIMDALTSAPGNILYLVELSGDIDIGEDKVAATTRKCVAEFDATELLIQFAKNQALINIEKIKPHCDADSYKIIIYYLKSDTYKPDATAVAYAAAYAAYAAASAAAASADAAASTAYARVAAARAVAYAAASAAAYAAADAAYAAAYAAASVASAAAAAADCARKDQEKMLLKMIKESTGWDI